ncbi:MAG: biopolymer transporter ExbD [Saprospiraceae bacterium]|nr:MAG: biopolymer transporter ExbD [Saprospiraceae bacterium]
MALKKRNKVKAEFSMASLTDMIFLLLIFFVLNSSVVAPNSLNLKLPGTSRAQIPSNQRIDDVSISADGRFYLNGKRIDPASLETALAQKAASNRDLDITISPAKGTPVKHVAYVMDIAMRYQINAILAAEK